MTLPTFWSLVTLPTLLGRVASDPLVLFLWPCSLKNTSPRILFLVVACDPTYLFGRVASDHFLALAIPKHLPWPDLHSDRIWPYSPTCHRKHGFCVAGATISMPLRCSPLTLYMLVGKCQMAFVWQVQQFWCLWDDLPWPYTCLLGRVKWLLCGRCNNFDASEMFSPDPIHACWEVSNGFCVAGAAILMPLRWSPLTLYMLVGKCQMAFVWQVQQFRCLWDVLPWPYTCLLGSVKWLLCGRCNNFDASEMISPDPIHACWEGSQVISTVTLCGRRNSLNASEKYYVTQCLATLASEMISPDPTCFLCGRCRILDGSEKFLVYTFCLCGRCNILDTSEKVTVTLREVPRDTSSFLWVLTHWTRIFDASKSCYAIFFIQGKVVCMVCCVTLPLFGVVHGSKSWEKTRSNLNHWKHGLQSGRCNNFGGKILIKGM